MSFPKVTKYGSMFTKFNQYLSILRSLNNDIKCTSPSDTAFFSHFCNSFRSVEANKLSLIPSSALQLISRGYKIKGHLQLRCKDCYMARKDGEVYVLCPSYPRHKQKKLTKRTKYSWILTYAFQSKSRPY